LVARDRKSSSHFTYWRKGEQKCKPRESGLTEQEPQVLMGLIDAGILFGIRILPSFSDSQITLLPPQQEGFVETYPSARAVYGCAGSV